jgi:kynurenine formamidase
LTAAGPTPPTAALDPSAFNVVDLSQPVSEDMAGWRGTERAKYSVAEVSDIAHSIPGGRISATWFSTAVHAGTHLDAARHMFPDGKSIDQYDPRRFVCRGVAVDVARGPAHELTADELAAADPGIRAGDAVLLSFGFAARYTDEAYYDHPYLSEGAAQYLAERDVNLVGCDVLTPDMPAHRRPTPFPYPVHTALLGRDILIIENLGPGLQRVLGREFMFVMAPITIPAADASPIVPLALVPR